MMSISAIAWADEPSAADIASARGSVGGVKLADAGNCKDRDRQALSRREALSRAETLTRLGVCQIQIGKIVDGTESLQQSRARVARAGRAGRSAAQDECEEGASRGEAEMRT